MTRDDRRAVVEAVARGDLTPEEAVERLDDVTDDLTDDLIGEPAPNLTIRGVLSGGCDIVVHGDDGVRDLRIDGPNRCHVTRSDEIVDVVGNIGDDAIVLVNPAARLRLTLNGAGGEVVGIRGGLNLHANLGDLLVAGRFREGHSTLNCNAGDVTIRFEPGSDVCVKLWAPVEVDADDEFVKTGRGEWTLGDGRSTLDVDGNFGCLRLVVE